MINPVHGRTPIHRNEMMAFNFTNLFKSVLEFKLEKILLKTINDLNHAVHLTGPRRNIFTAELGDFYASLRAAIERAYTANNNSRVVVVSHSMGSPVMNYFYHNHVNQASFVRRIDFV